MPMGKAYRLTGILLWSDRGLILEVEGGGSYVLDTNADARRHVGRRVLVEGARSGFDRLDVDRLSPI